ncbi:MAG: DUF192 domain-containing protein, partial [Novosphingobium sp.]
MRLVLLSGLAVALAACSPSSSEAGAQSTQGTAAVHPVSGLPVVPLRIVHGDQTHNFRVELARTGEEQAKGLMFRTAMGADEGMIFPMAPPRGASFWMRNTVIPLDLIFVGPDGKILNIAANAIPYDETPLMSTGPVKAVLELNGGRAKEL